MNLLRAHSAHSIEMNWGLARLITSRMAWNTIQNDHGLPETLTVILLPDRAYPAEQVRHSA